MVARTSSRPSALAFALTVAALVLGVCACSEGRDAAVRVVGNDPRIIVVQGVPELFVPGVESGGKMRHDPESGCMYLLMRGKEQVDVALLWPEGSLPISRDGRRGVRVAGHDPIFEDEVVLFEGTPFDIAALKESGEFKDFASAFDGLEGAMAECGGLLAGFYVSEFAAVR